MRSLLMLALVVLVLAGLAAAIAVPRKDGGKWKGKRDTPQMARLRKEWAAKRRGNPDMPEFPGSRGLEDLDDEGLRAKMMEKFAARKAAKAAMKEEKKPVA